MALWVGVGEVQTANPDTSLNIKKLLTMTMADAEPDISTFPPGKRSHGAHPAGTCEIEEMLWT